MQESNQGVTIFISLSKMMAALPSVSSSSIKTKLQIRGGIYIIFFYFSMKTYVVGTH